MSTSAKRVIRNAGPDWDDIRSQFPTTENFTYLDTARKALLPRSVESAIGNWLQDIYQHVGEKAFSMDATEKTRETVARVFGAPARNVALIKNTSEGMNIIAQGYEGLREGDNVLISLAEHENNTFPWRHLDRRGVEVRFAKPDHAGRLTVDDYRKLADKRTRLISSAWVSYATGYRADIPKLGQYCREIGAKLVVDGVQGIGVLSNRIDQLGADAVVAGGHKAQFSLAGAGFMYMTDEMTGATVPPYAAKFSFTSNDRLQDNPVLAPDAHRFEYGNPNFIGCWVQRSSAEFIESIGLGHIEDRVRELTTAALEGAKKRHVAVRTPQPWEERAGIIGFDSKGDVEAAAKALKDKRRIIVSVKDGHLRASIHFYNTHEEVEMLLDAISEIMPA